MSWTSACLMGLASVALGQALQINNGFFDRRAIVWLLGALVLVVGAVLTSRLISERDRLVSTALPAVLLGGVLLQIAQLLSAPPLMYASLRQGRHDPLLMPALATTAILSIVVTVTRRPVRIVAFSGVVLTQLAAGTWVIRTVPRPPIDVVTVQQQALERIEAGRSPYSMTFRNIYGHNSGFYAEGMATDEKVLFGYPYPPLTLAFSVPADWLLGDFRYSEIAALAAAAFLIASLGWTRHSMLSAILLLTTPRVLFQIEQGWTEPFAIFLLALTMAALWRRSASPVPLGLTMAIKQYLPIALVLAPLLPLADKTPRGAFVAQAIAISGIVTVPFLIWDPNGFVSSVVLLQFREPFRTDSLSVPAWLARSGVTIPPLAATAVATIAAAILALRTLPQSAGGFGAGMALLSLAMFAFGKKAFCNYYFFVLGVLALAIAAGGRTPAAGDAQKGPHDPQRALDERVRRQTVRGAQLVPGRASDLTSPARAGRLHPAHLNHRHWRWGFPPRGCPGGARRDLCDRARRRRHSAPARPRSPRRAGEPGQLDRG
jgi:hypothetical protein